MRAACAVGECAAATAAAGALTHLLTRRRLLPAGWLCAPAGHTCTGVRVVLQGILDVEAHHGGAWRRVIFWGEPEEEPTSNTPGQLLPACCRGPKTLPDFESAGGCWVALQELPRLTLRSAAEPCRWFAAMASGEAAGLPLFNSLALPPEWAGVFEGFPVSR